MDRCAVLVDAGYLLGAASTLLGGEQPRSSLVVQYAELVQALIAEAQQQTGLPVLRMLWYDGARDAQPRAEHRVLRVLSDVKVRLGELVTRDGRTQQKGVDSYLQRDLTTMARNGAVADVVLVGGDEDLRRGLEEAQDYGLRVHLWGVQAATADYNQSQSLIAEADRRWVIPEEWIRRFVSLRTDTTPPPPTLEQSPVTVVAEPADTVIPPANGDTDKVTPADLARLAASFARNGPAPLPLETLTALDGQHLPLLRTLTSGRDTWADNEQDVTDASGSPQQVGARFGQRWARRATAEQRADLLQLRPYAPKHLDGEMLRYAERWGVETWEDEPAKLAVRAGFWDAVAAAISQATP
jgi:uncharacterized LabA/DUF88 family protein